MIQTVFRLTIIFFSGVLLFVEARAETMYVSDTMKITFRSGPGNDRKITSLLSTGQRVEVLQPDGDWVLVRLDDGKEGWVLNRYLTPKVPCGIEIESLRNEHRDLNDAASALKEENAVLKTDKKELSRNLAATQSELSTVRTRFETLKEESVHFIELKAKYEKATLELSKEKKRADRLDRELNEALERRHIKWFLSGTGVLVLGMILGVSSKREKRRSSLL